jgi:aarF domain-containing kinase
MRQLINYTGVVPPGLYLDRVIEVAREELLEECDYLREVRRRCMLRGAGGFFFLDCSRSAIT